VLVKHYKRTVSKLRRNVFPTAYIVVVLLFYACSQFIPTSDSIPFTVELEEPAKATLDFLVETMKLTTGLNTALLAAIAAITVKGREWSERWGRWEGTLVVAALCGVAVSYYGIYVEHASVLSMIYNGTIYPFERRLDVALKLQYYGTLAAVFCIGLAFTRLLEARRSAA